MVRQAIPSDDTTLVLRQTYDASIETLYRAWTDPHQLQRWLRPNEDIQAEFVEVELRKGGVFRIGYRVPGEDDLNIIAGRYCEIVPNARLVFSWSWEVHPEFPGEETLVAIDFVEVGQQTELTLSHQRFPTKMMRDVHHWGWTGATELLVEHCRYVCRSLPDGQRPF